ncbi:hypothetical protein WJX74_008165 [Apatococcus lobatus]|uniref:Uncharacterized protein n=1 Tax=Apatococcus lobatus TaxID=904363 RepID=A0AAW1QL14_9CHLO
MLAARSRPNATPAPPYSSLPLLLPPRAPALQLERDQFSFSLLRYDSNPNGAEKPSATFLPTSPNPSRSPPHPRLGYQYEML